MNKPGAFLQALGGHAVDLYRLARFDVRNPHSLSKFRQINALRRRTGATTLVEAGTYLGVTAGRCARVFARVITIELDPALAAKARAHLSGRRNVEVIEGDALREFPRVLARPDVHDPLVFLDGHYSGGATAHGDLAEPAVEVVDAIAPFRSKVRGIVIDDFRCFGTDPGWPTKSALLAAIERHLPEFDIAVHLDQVVLRRT